MDWTVRGLNPDGGEIFSIPVHPTSCEMYTSCFRETKRPARNAEHPPLLALRLRKAWNSASAYPLRPHVYVMGRHLTSPLLICCTFGMVPNIYKD